MNRIPSHHTEMEFVEIPGTSIRASRVALGTWAIGGWMWGGTDESDAIAHHPSRARQRHQPDRHRAGLRLRPFRGDRRQGAGAAAGAKRVIATKVGLDWKDGKLFRNASRARIVKEAEDSLRRLQTDVIDIYQVHWPDPKTPIEEAAEAMATLHRAGKIRAIGVSNFSPAQMERSAPLRRCTPRSRPTICSNAASKQDVLPYCRAHDIALLAYGSLCRGLLPAA